MYLEQFIQSPLTSATVLFHSISIIEINQLAKLYSQVNMSVGTNMFINGKLDNSPLYSVCFRLKFENWVWMKCPRWWNCPHTYVEWFNVSLSQGDICSVWQMYILFLNKTLRKLLHCIKDNIMEPQHKCIKPNSNWNTWSVDKANVGHDNEVLNEWNNFRF